MTADHKVGFTDYATEFLYVCDTCGATVPRDHTEQHRAWHERLRNEVADTYQFKRRNESI